MKTAGLHRRIADALGKCALILLCSCGCASNFLYYPDRIVYQTPANHGLKYEDVLFRSRDGTLLTGWFVPAIGEPAGTVIHFHGNAQNMTAHFSYVDWLPAEHFNVFTFDYRGYGKSQGTPSRRGLYEDCVAAIGYVSSRQDVDTNSFFILGQSLGAATVSAVLGEKQFSGINAVVLDSSFCSYRQIARDSMARIPGIRFVRWPLSFLVIDNRHSPCSSVADIAPTPLALIHGTADQVIPYHHSNKLFASARKPKELWTVENGSHTDSLASPDSPYRRKLVEFFKASAHTNVVEGSK